MFDVLNFTTLRPGAFIPIRSTEGAAGYDLHAWVDGPVEIYPGQRKLIHTGLAIALPKHIAGLVTPRSGLAIKHGVTVLNAPGLIDPDFRGEIGVVLINHGTERFVIEPFMRIAQLVLTPFCSPLLHHTKSLDATARGAGGFGSTGV